MQPSTSRPLGREPRGGKRPNPFNELSNANNPHYTAQPSPVSSPLHHSSLQLELQDYNPKEDEDHIFPVEFPANALESPLNPDASPPADGDINPTTDAFVFPLRRQTSFECSGSEWGAGTAYSSADFDPHTGLGKMTFESVMPEPSETAPSVTEPSVTEPSVFEPSLTYTLTHATTTSNPLSPMGLGRQEGLSERFDIRPKTYSLSSGSWRDYRNRAGPAVATCVSASGKTIARIESKGLSVYKAPSSGQHVGTPQYVGRFQGRNWMCGLEATPKMSQPVLSASKRCEFTCAAVSDEILAAGLSDSSCLLLFSVEDTPESYGRFVRKFEPTNDSRVIKKILFNPTNTELAVLYSLLASSQEVWVFFRINKSTLEPAGNWDLHLEMYSQVFVNVALRDSHRLFTYHTMSAKYSKDGRRIVSCTDHTHGSALVSILRIENDSWKEWGTHQIHKTLHNWDDDCLGFTGVDLYHPV